MKKVFLFAALAVASFAVQAQDESKPLTFSVGAEAALPIGDFVDSPIKFSDIYSFGAGLSLQGKYALDESLGITLSAGYISYFEKEYLGEKPGSLGVIPVLAGIEYNFTPEIFASAQLGYSIYTGKYLDDAKMSGFSYAPGIGYRFTPNFSVQLKYQGTSAKIKFDDGGESDSGSLSHIGLRIAYSF
ncbi:MAG: porin family protein [Rhizobacter sp.]|nr:porin family protein [Ferruginibacter sp.]